MPNGTRGLDALMTSGLVEIARVTRAERQTRALLMAALALAGVALWLHWRRRPKRLSDHSPEEIAAIMKEIVDDATAILRPAPSTAPVPGREG